MPNYEIFKPLIAFLNAQDDKAVKAFTEANPTLDYNDVDPEGRSALWVALSSPEGVPISNDILKILLLNEDNINQMPLVNPTKPYLNVQPKDAKILGYCLSERNISYIQYAEKLYPLIMYERLKLAIEKGETKIIEMILKDEYFNPWIHPCAGSFGFIFVNAIFDDESETVAIALLKHPHFDSSYFNLRSDADGYSALMYAATANRVAVVNAILKHDKFDPSYLTYLNNNGDNILMHILDVYYEKILEALLQSDKLNLACFTQLDKHGNNVYTIAKQTCPPNVVKAIEKCRAFQVLTKLQDYANTSQQLFSLYGWKRNHIPFIKELLSLENLTLKLINEKITSYAGDHVINSDGNLSAIWKLCKDTRPEEEISPEIIQSSFSRMNTGS